MRKYISFFFGAVAALTMVETVQAENVATRWMVHALDSVRAANTSTPRAGRVYAMTTVAMYDAVNGISGGDGGGQREHALVPPDGAPEEGHPRAAAAAAAHAVLVALFPGRSALLNGALASDLALLADEDPDEVEAGRAWGDYVGQQVVALRSNDGTRVAETQPGGSGPGVFPRPFANAQFRNMAPFGVADLAPYDTLGPPVLSSEAYAEAFNEVKVLGNINDPDTERTAIMKHWQAENFTARETGLWFKAALNIIEDQGTDRSLSKTVRLLALLGMGIADSVTVSWNDKYEHRFWRPGDAIRAASTDDNPDTEEDTGWNPRNGVNNFGGTPEYTSGTSTIAGASSTILAGFYCANEIPFSFQGELGTPARHYSSFTEAAEEAGRSRIFGGIHSQFSNLIGRAAGGGIGAEIVTTRLTRRGGCQGIRCDCPQH